ncbi:MAG TPA: hypothetical protein VK519_03805 [Pinirhizobacter sp.]|uniref:hypothetical protein n=1 Tax=Pinirhizobacter sp. TaxID=2950432 RepID=UPI002BFA530F|nr:hypothetical protein [Pinirhizobacter sp.]HMH67026.1 hypothetical protein [Pinirhizobacter sp.]
MLPSTTSTVKAQVDTALKMQAEETLKALPTPNRATLVAISDSYTGRVHKASSVDKLFSSGHIAGDHDNDYDDATSVADALVEDGAMESSHPQHSLFMTIADLIYAFDQRNYPMPYIPANQMLRFLMDQHGLKQTQPAVE